MNRGKPVVLSYSKLDEENRKKLETLSELHIAEEEREKLEKILPEVEVVICFKLEREHLRMMKNLKMIQAITAGVDSLPWDAIPDSVIVCSNAGSNDYAVAEHTWALILALAKNLHIHVSNMKNGVYDPSRGVGVLHGRKIGIVGMGAIGRRIAEIAKMFNMRVLAITRSGRTTIECDFIGDPTALDKVLSESDVVVIAAPLTKHTRWMINREKLEKMKKDAILVNIARADIIKRDDLLDFLRENPEFRFASDVWWNTQERFAGDYEFMRFPNVIGTPWIGGGLGSREVWEGMVDKAVENVLKYLRGEKPDNIVPKSEYV